MLHTFTGCGRFLVLALSRSCLSLSSLKRALSWASYYDLMHQLPFSGTLELNTSTWAWDVSLNMSSKKIDKR